MNVDDVTVYTAESAQSAAPSVLSLLTQQQVASASVAVFNAFGVSVVSAVRAGARVDRPGVHADLTDQAYDPELSAYFDDSDNVPPPSAFHHVSPSPPHATSPIASVRVDSRQSRAASWVDNVRSAAASQRQLRAPSRQSVVSVRSHVSGRQSTHSQAPDPVIELMNKMFDKIAGDAAAQRADAVAQRSDAAAHAAVLCADADRREQQMQATMEREIERKERETRLQLCVEQLEKEAATAQLQLARPATIQRDSVTPAAMTSADSRAPPPPLTASIVTCLTAGTFVQSTAAARDVRSLQHAALPSMTDYTQPPTMSDMTVAAGPPRVPSRTPALFPYSLVYTIDIDRTLPAAYAVDVDHALPITNSFQPLEMAAGRRDLPMPLYTAPFVAPAVTSVVPAVHTSSFSSGAYTRAPAGAFIAHTSHGLAVAFFIGAYHGWGNAAMPMGYPHPAPTLPTPVMGGPMVSMVDHTSTLIGTLPISSSLPLQTDTTSTITTAVTSAVDSVSSKLAPGLKFLALAPLPPGVATYPDGQALPVPAATTPAVSPPATTTPAAAQQPGSMTTVPAATSASTAAIPAAPAVLPDSTTTSSAVPTTSPPAVAVSAALPASTATSSVVTAPPLSTGTAVSSSSSTGVAVTVSSGLNPPGNSYVTPTQSVTLPVIVVYSQNVLKRYDGFLSPKEYMDHFDIIADVNGWRTDLDKLKHLKAALNGRAAYQIKDLDESDPAKAFAALRAKLLNHFGSPNEASSARQQFCHRTQSEGKAIGEYAEALLKLSKAGWPGQQRDTDL